MGQCASFIKSHPCGMESFDSLWSAPFPYAIGNGKTLPVGNSDGIAPIEYIEPLDERIETSVEASIFLYDSGEE